MLREDIGEELRLDSEHARPKPASVLKQRRTRLKFSQHAVKVVAFAAKTPLIINTLPKMNILN